MPGNPGSIVTLCAAPLPSLRTWNEIHDATWCFERVDTNGPFREEGNRIFTNKSNGARTEVRNGPGLVNRKIFAQSPYSGILVAFGLLRARFLGGSYPSYWF